MESPLFSVLFSDIMMRDYLSLKSMQQGMLVACDDGILQCIAHCVLNMQESRALLLPKLMSAAAEHLIGVRNSSPHHSAFFRRGRVKGS